MASVRGFFMHHQQFCQFIAHCTWFWISRLRNNSLLSSHRDRHKYVQFLQRLPNSMCYLLESPAICLEDFNNALKFFKPASLHGIKLHQGSDLTWQDVGGLNDIKQTLMETLEWPAKVFCLLKKLEDTVFVVYCRLHQVISYLVVQYVLKFS